MRGTDSEAEKKEKKMMATEKERKGTVSTG
jgi:hypothetical protein